MYTRQIGMLVVVKREYFACLLYNLVFLVAVDTILPLFLTDLGVCPNAREDTSGWSY